MFRTPSDGTDAFVAGSEQVLLCVSNPRDRQLLLDHLEREQHTVVTAEDPASLPEFDLCLVDTKSYPAVADELARRREAVGAVHLPVLLILGPNDSEAKARQLAKDVDDVLPVPSSREVLKSRVDSLVRSRRQSEQLALFRRAMDDAITGISIATADGDQELQYVNDAFAEITGYDRSDAVGANCRFLQGPATEPEPVQRIRAAIDAEEPVSVELRNYRKDGTMFWNHVEVAPVYNEGHVTHYVGFQQDITDRVEQNNRLQRYEHIVRAAGDPIYSLDASLELTLLNEASEQLCGLPREALLGTHIKEAFGESHAARLATAILDLSAQGVDTTAFESSVTGPKGQSRQYQTLVGLLPGEAFDGVVCVSRDITDDRERESRLSVLDRVLRHNLRNKLLVLMGQVERIEDRTDDAEIYESTQAIERAADELLDIAETARDFERTIDPDSSDTVGPVDITTHVSQAVEETKLEYSDTSFVTEVPDHLWAMAHDSFELAMTELLEQAASNCDVSEVITSVSSNSPEGTTTVCVSHDGQSIDEVKRAALSAGAESDLQHTSGLGLWFVRWMAINSGGSFSITDNDPGTRIELSLPVVDPPGN